MDESNHRKWQVAIELAKLAATIVVAVVILVVIQHPSSVLSKRQTSEEIDRERARLLIDIVSLESDTDRRRAIEVLRYAYSGSDPDFISQIANLFASEISLREIEADLPDSETGNPECDAFAAAVRSTQEEIASLIRDADLELNEGGISGQPGPGRIWRGILEQIEERRIGLSELIESRPAYCR